MFSVTTRSRTGGSLLSFRLSVRLGVQPGGLRRRPEVIAACQARPVGGEQRVDEAYTDAEFVRLYDAENPWHPMDDFYQRLDLAAASVLDVGCGTGTRLARTRAVGHGGRLVGVDPAEAMLAVARAKTDAVDWIRGDAQTLDLGARFALVTMTGHAFQLLLDDDAVRAAVASLRRHLEPGGLLAFETRNPAARPWQAWTREGTLLVIEAPDGEPYESWVEDPAMQDGDLVTFTGVLRSLRTGRRRTTASTLRFVDPDHLGELLGEAGFTVEARFGDWDSSPVTPSSPEVVVLARA
jgi:SAM-dependent methyltransferase